MAKKVKGTVKTPVNTTKKVKPGADAKSEKKAKSTKPPKYTGRTSGLRVQAFQDQLLSKNYKAKLSDAKLATAMRAEFPNAVAFTEKHVAGMRSQFNHGHRPTQEGVKPTNPLPKFDDEGNVITARARGPKKAKAEKKVKGAKKVKKVAKPVVEEEEEEAEEETDDDDADEEDEDEGDEEM